MKKKLTSIITCTLLAPVVLQGNTDCIRAETPIKQVQNTQIKQEKKFDKTGLLGYYFKDNNFKDLVLIDSTHGSKLIYDQQAANSLLDKKQQEYHSIRWIGSIKSKETGDFTFELSDDEHATIEIDGKIISQKGKNKQVVHLEKDKLVSVKIEYQCNETINLDSNVFQSLKFFKKDSENKLYQMQQDELRNPEVSRKDTRVTLSKKGIKQTENIIDDEKVDDEKDSDDDLIPDNWEVDGYTIKRQSAVKWDDSFAEKGYQKYVSNPNRSHTTGDPYSDFEKAKMEVPSANAKEAFNPLVAAFPSVNVGLEQVIISKNQDMSHSVGSRTSNNWSYTNTEGASIEAGIGPKGLSFGVSANYQHSETVAKEWGYSTDDSLHLNEAQSAFLNANVRYHNVGTGAIYEVKPTTSFVLNRTTIGTIKAKDNTLALSLSPGESYPKRGQNGLAINTMDDFNASPIPLNKEQLDTYISNNSPILLETNQVEGKYAEVDGNGQIVIGGDWNGIRQEIENRTATIIVDTGKGVSEKKVAGKDYTKPEDKTPSLTLKDALKLAYPEEITEKDGLLYYNDTPIYESSVMTYLDENTAKEVKKQLNDKTGNFKDVSQLYEVKLTPKMNFTIKTASLYDGAEEDSSHRPIGTWSYTYNPKVDGNTGGKKYQSAHPSANVVLSLEAKEKLKKGNKYYLSLYMKADSDTAPTIEVKGEKSTITSKKIKLNNKGYQRVDILVENTNENPINQIYVHGDDKTKVSWDDITLTEISVIKNMKQGVKDEEVRKAHTFKSELIGGTGANKFMNQLTLHVNPLKDNQNKPIQFEYKVKDNGKDLGNKLYKPDQKGNITLNFLEYNNGRGIDRNHNIQVYAVYGGKEVKVSELNHYNISGLIYFRNDGEDGLPEPYGNIKFIFEGQSFEVPEYLWFKSDHNSTQWKIPYNANFASFNSNPNKVILKADVKESDDMNGDDTLAYLNDEYKSSSLNGEANFQGDETGSSVKIIYNIQKLGRK
uniref:Binary vegetative insecticidal protein n=1 Tax=Bacillus thuringiensis TaxID=1428 RepID=A0A1P8BJT2_BACTU|nr:binary vegetative insecticidal protein [Bacillus thuringiensis]